MKFWQFGGITVISGVLGIILSQLILPGFVANLAPTLEGLSVVDATNIISWAAILLTLLALMGTVVVLSKDYKLGPMAGALALSFILTVVVLCGGCFLWLAWGHPETVADASLWIKLVKFYAYPSLVTLVVGDPQPIWLISTALFLAVFNSSFYFLTEVT